LDLTLFVLVSLSTITGLIGTVFGLFLLYLSLKIRTEFREVLRYEIDRYRKLYQFIRERGQVSVVDVVRKMEGIPVNHPEFPVKQMQWEKFLKERVRGELKTLNFSNGFYSLSDEVKKFFVYDDPSVGDLLRYIYLKYIKRGVLFKLEV